MGHAGIEDLEPGRGRNSRRAQRRRARAAAARSGQQLPSIPPSSSSGAQQNNSSNDVETPTANPKAMENGIYATAPAPDSHEEAMRQYLWVSALGDYENDDFRFSDFQPCYMACIRDLEAQIKGTIRRRVDVADARGSIGDGTVGEMEGLLVRYSQLIDALEAIEHKDRVYEEDGLRSGKNDALTRLSGERRRITQPPEDHDKAHAALQENLILLTLGYIYNWDAANSVKRRFGNVTKTLDRVLVGLGGGAMLLVPMIIMVNVTNLTARLVIVSVATILFALGVSLMNDVRRDGVIGATAAYAAVMVVFIGSNQDLTG